MMDSLLSDEFMGNGPSFGDTTNREKALKSWKYNVELFYELIYYTRSLLALFTISNAIKL
jgi:hypothetical protein